MSFIDALRRRFIKHLQRPIWKTVVSVGKTGRVLMDNGTVARLLSPVQLKAGDQVLVYMGQILRFKWEDTKFVPIPIIQKHYRIFIAELTSSNDPYNPQVQIFSDDGFFIDIFSDPDEILYTGGFGYLFLQYDVAYYQDFVYVTNWWTGYLEKYTLTGILLSGVNLTAIVQFGGGKAHQQLAIAEDRIAVVSNILGNLNRVYVFDMDYNYLYYIDVPEWSTGAGGIAIDNGKIYVAWNQNITEDPPPGQQWIARVGSYSLDTGELITLPLADTRVGKVIEALAVYDGKLYATSPDVQKIIIFDTETLEILMVFDTTETITSPAEPRGIAVNESGIWVTGFYYRASCASYPDYCPNDNVYLYHYDLNFILQKKIGEYGFNNGQFHRPFGIELMEVT